METATTASDLIVEKLGFQVSSLEIIEPPITHREEHILKSCENGQIDAINLAFSASGITAPAHPITIHNVASHTLPCTHLMVEAAVRGKQVQTIEHIYATFPSARIYGPELIASIELGNIEIFKILDKQSQSWYDVVHKEFPDRETSLIKACKGQNPHIALYLLEKDADPNYSGASGN